MHGEYPTGERSKGEPVNRGSLSSPLSRRRAATRRVPPPLGIRLEGGARRGGVEGGGTLAGGESASDVQPREREKAFYKCERGGWVGVSNGFIGIFAKE